MTCCACSCEAKVYRNIEVSIGPGATLLATMPWRPYSRTIVRKKACRAPFTAAYGACPASPSFAASEVTPTNDPPWFSSITGSSSRVASTGPR